MEEQNIYSKNTSSTRNKYIKALLAGIGISVLIGIILAIIAIWIEQEFFIIVLLGLALAGYIITRFLPKKSVYGALVGGFTCVLAYLIYVGIMSIMGYWYEDGNSSFWIAIVISLIYGLSVGYKGKKEFDEE